MAPTSPRPGSESSSASRQTRSRSRSTGPSVGCVRRSTSRGATKCGVKSSQRCKGSQGNRGIQGTKPTTRGGIRGMRRFWKRPSEFGDLEAALRESRPVPSDAAVKAVVERVRHKPQWLRARTRFAAAVALTAVALALAAAFGGISFAAYAVKPATDVVNVVKRINEPSAPRLHDDNPIHNQYGHCGGHNQPPCHGPPPPPPP